MNKSLYKILYVIQRIINLPTLPIAIPVGIVWAMINYDGKIGFGLEQGLS